MVHQSAFCVCVCAYANPRFFLEEMENEEGMRLSKKEKEEQVDVWNVFQKGVLNFF